MSSSHSHLDDLCIRFECKNCSWAVSGSAWSTGVASIADRHEQETGHKVEEQYDD